MDTHTLVQALAHAMPLHHAGPHLHHLPHLPLVDHPFGLAVAAVALALSALSSLPELSAASPAVVTVRARVEQCLVLSHETESDGTVVAVVTTNMGGVTLTAGGRTYQVGRGVTRLRGVAGGTLTAGR